MKARLPRPLHTDEPPAPAVEPADEDPFVRGPDTVPVPPERRPTWRIWKQPARPTSPVDAATRRRQKAEARRHAMAKRYALEAGLSPDRPIVDATPILPAHEKVVENTEVVPDRARARIIYDTARRSYRYQVVEPTLEPLEADAAEFLRETLYRTLDAKAAVDDTGDRRQLLLDAIEEAIVDHNVLLDDVGRERVVYHLMRDFLGYGPIDVLLNDPLIEDISCDGPNIPVYVFHRQYESIPTNVIFPDDDAVDAFVIRLAQMCGKHISLADPLLDATLPDSSRLQATLSREVTARGSTFTIRRFRSDPLSVTDLVRLGTISAEMASFFWLMLEEGDSLILAGGTASGKTTSLNAVCQFIPPQRKVVSIEDTREISLRHDNWIAGVARPGFSDGQSRRSDAIDMYRLLEAALRQRPEYLLVGEVRGAEAKTLFQAMATGHATYSTMHADSAMSAVYRLENPPINIPRIMLQTLDAIAIQVQVRMGERLVRRIREVVEIVGIHPDSGDLITNTVFRWDVSSDTHRFLGSSQILRNIMAHRNMTLDQVEAEWQERTRLIQRMAEGGIRHVDEVTAVIADYYRSPRDVLDRVRTLPVPMAGPNGSTNGVNGHTNGRAVVSR